MSSSCMDDDMFPRHELLSFDPSFKQDEAALFSPSSALPPLASTTVKPVASSCGHEELLHEQQRAIASLQQDVFALRHLLEGEMNRLRMETTQQMAALEARLLQSCKATCEASASAAVASSPATPAKVDAAPPTVRTSSSSSPAAMRHSVWSGDFLDSDCGDDFAPPHPSQLLEKDQHALFTKVMEEKEQPVKLPSPPSSYPSTTPRDEPPKPASGPSPTALSISSLTALINPAGLPLTEVQLITLACRILADHGSVPVGKMGSLLHKAANDHTLPALLKERYGGLKKFLQAQSQYFILGEDHPYNPHVALVGQQQLPACAQPVSNGSASSGGCSAGGQCTMSKDAGHASTGLLHEQGRDVLSASTHRDAVSAGSVRDAYARSLVDSSLMDERDSSSFFSHSLTSRKAVSQPQAPSSSASTSRPFFPSSSASTVSSYSTRLQESLTGSGRDFRHVELLLTPVVSLDCEMVGCGVDGCRSMLARCSVVSYHGAVLYDAFVQAGEVVSDYRTHVSGIRPGDLDAPRAIPFHQAQREVEELLQGRVVVAHSVVGDLQALQLSLPLHLLRDTAHFPLLCPDRPRSLRALVHERLGWMTFQHGEHDSVEDARAVMSLYRSVEDAWEQLIKEEQAQEEREKQQQQQHLQLQAARITANNARQRALVVEQQQRRDSYQAHSSTAHSQYPSASSPLHSVAGPAALREGASLLERREGGGHFGGARGGVALNLHPLPSSHSSIHSALWGK